MNCLYRFKFSNHLRHIDASVYKKQPYSRNLNSVYSMIPNKVVLFAKQGAVRTSCKGFFSSSRYGKAKESYSFTMA